MDQENMQGELRVDLKTDTPVVGREITPEVHLSRELQGYPVEFQWYSKRNPATPAFCSVHRGVKATFQCQMCLDLKLPICDSYHCSVNCYRDAWPNHRERHDKATGTSKFPMDADDQTARVLRKDPLDESYDKEDAIMIEDDPQTWTSVASSKTYTPTVDDFRCILGLIIIVAKCPSGPARHVAVTEPVTVAYPRRMIKVSPMRSITDPQSSVAATFRVISYNILAQIYADCFKYPYCPALALTWDYRKQNLLLDILAYDADIICLQEVQDDHFEEFFKPELVQRGYAVTYKKRKLGVYTTKDVTDGCATFFRTSKFREVRKYELVYPDIAAALLHTLPPEQFQIGCPRLPKDNVALVTILELVDIKATCGSGTAMLCVANAHIHANQDFKDVKLWQVATLINGLEMIGNASVPVLFCGDLNSLPGSAPHSLVVSGQVNRDHPQFPDDPIRIFDHVKLNHTLNLRSAYTALFLKDEEQRQKMDPESMEPKFTHFTVPFSGTLDYIFYQVNRFRVEAVLEVVDEDIPRKNIAFPSPDWPSDHIVLGADLSLLEVPK